MLGMGLKDVERVGNDVLFGWGWSDGAECATHKSTKRDTLIMTSYTKIRHGFSEKHQLWLGWLATV
jgi:hypothetical protein